MNCMMRHGRCMVGRQRWQRRMQMQRLSLLRCAHVLVMALQEAI